MDFGPATSSRHRETTTFLPGLIFLKGLDFNKLQVDVPPYFASIVNAIFIKIADADTYAAAARRLTRLTGSPMQEDDVKLAQKIRANVQFIRYQKIKVRAIARISMEIYRDIISAVAVGSAA